MKSQQFSLSDGGERMSNPVGELAAMSSFLITCIFFAVQNVTRRACLNLLAIGKAGPVARSTRWHSRGQRPRLQQCGNANSLITFFAPLKAMARSGITFEIIQSERGSFQVQTTGNTLAKLRRWSSSRGR